MSSNTNNNNDTTTDPQAQTTQQLKSPTTFMGTLFGIREMLVSPLQKSAFLERGVLTPDEFVKAGDELVYTCPSWCWASNSRNAKPYLPPDKQYLIQTNVPCLRRVKEMEESVVENKEESDNNNDGWLVSTILKASDADNTEKDDFDIIDNEGQVVVKEQAAVEQQAKPADDDDEYADMADYYEESDDIITDDDAITNSNLLHTYPTARTYDISLTYDKYYQTPRVWLTGRSSRTGQPLTGPEMLQDVLTDYAQKTVTIESHPHTAGPHASIHPCKHGNVMKRIVQNMSEGEATIEGYLFIFLKFVSSILPTISYDFTMQVTASTTTKVSKEVSNGKGWKE